MDNRKPKISELKPNIYQIRAVQPGSHVYLIKGQWRNVLIDTGMADGFPQLKQCLGELGLAPADIDLIILTHEHFDHIGAAPLFFETAVVAAHRLAANKIQLQDEFVMMNKYFNLSGRTFHADIWLESDTIIELGNYKLQTLHTPGHCSRCISLDEPFKGLEEGVIRCPSSIRGLQGPFRGAGYEGNFRTSLPGCEKISPEAKRLAFPFRGHTIVFDLSKSIPPLDWWYGSFTTNACLGFGDV